MKRDYLDAEEDDVVLFTGNEIEKTHFYGKKTLFVVGLHSNEYLIQLLNENECNHIYLGANHFFKKYVPDSIFNQIESLLELGYFITLDIPFSLWDKHHQKLSYHCNHDNFCLNLSVKLPRIELIKNVCIKIDDEGFNLTNTGVWVFKKDDEYKTNWTEYQKDFILKQKGEL